MFKEHQAPSEISQLDHLISLLEEDADFPEIFAVFQSFDEVLGILYGVYLSELQFLAAGEPQNKAANEIPAEFREVRKLVAELTHHLERKSKVSAREVALALKSQVGRLFGKFAQMKSQTLEGTRYSEVPFTQELLRVAHLYLEGRLPKTALVERLDAFCHYHEQLELTVEHMIPSQLEQAAFESAQDDLSTALGLQIEGIEELDLALELADDDRLRTALDTLIEAADILHSVYFELKEADQTPVTIACFRCGTDNSPESRLCGGCSAVLPRAEVVSRSTVEFKENAESFDSDDSSIPEELLKLQGAVEDSLASGQSISLSQAVAAFRSKLEKTRGRWQRLESPPPSLPAEHVQLLKRGHQAFREALEVLEEGLQLLETGAPGLQAGLLDQGLQLLGEGFARFQDFQEIFRQAEQLSPRP